ncbi:hypothetical protein [Lacrimispora sp.]|uniref:hypothetical protein n=1 Tax=Lacrimispora sp. TaxID=2719234 RepID=UPI0028AC134E|nr:hypothetical protein [Lacrimispora sp.]
MTNQVILHHRLCGKLANQLSENGIVTYISLQALYNNNKEEQWFTLNAINRVLKPEKKITKEDKMSIKDGLEELEKYGYIKILSNDVNEYHLDMSDLYVEEKSAVGSKISNPFGDEYDKDMVCYKDLKGRNINEYTNYFTYYNLESFIKVYKEQGNKKRIFKYLFFYLGMKATNLNNKDGKECYFFQATREELAYESGISINTIDKYNSTLLENKIIYVCKYDQKWKDSGKQVKNIYGLYKDKDKLEEEKSKFLEEQKDELCFSPLPKKKEKKESKEEVVTTEETKYSISRTDQEVNDSNMITKSETDENIPKGKETQKSNIYDWKKSLQDTGYMNLEPKVEPQKYKELDISQLL